jgi:hypothetical protein
MAPRPYWKGYLKLSLVTCPVSMSPATSESEKVRFHTLNRETGNRVVSQYVDAVIRLLRDEGSWEGEGFSIVSIQCAMLEFLAACRGGLIYRHRNPQPPFEYSASGDIFASFLAETAPFSALFTRDDAVEFYRQVRCALLHEARTKSGWTIHASGQTGVNCLRKIVYRNTFQTLIEDYIDGYGRDLLANTDLQAAFVRKFDDLAS